MTPEERFRELARQGTWWNEDEVVQAALYWCASNRDKVRGLRANQWEAIRRCGYGAEDYADFQEKVSGFLSEKGKLFRAEQKWRSQGVSEALLSGMDQVVSQETKAEGGAVSAQLEQLGKQVGVPAGKGSEVDRWVRLAKARLFLETVVLTMQMERTRV